MNVVIWTQVSADFCWVVGEAHLVAAPGHSALSVKIGVPFNVNSIMEEKKSMNETAKLEENEKARSGIFQPIWNFLEKYKWEIGLTAMIVYLFLLGLGTIGEIWEVEWILDLPIFRSVGKWER